MEVKVSDIFFDLDHTLWDFEKNSALAFREVFMKYGIDVNLEDFLLIYIPINLKYWELYQYDKITQDQLRYGRLKEAFDQLGYEIVDDMINILSVEYIQYLPQFNHLFEGTEEILEYLSKKYRLHIITNGFHEVQGNKLRNSNIHHYFRTITNSETAGVKKPHPQIFEYALKQANVQKENCIMIGDNLEADVLGAINCGMDAILFNPEKPATTENIKCVAHLIHLKEYL
ncbi:YjjG family noncanonical pyrimidine nucleotidase [Flavobacterium pallidum]|uniref:Noncanonical pyrimidine nucleotidase, YjjG family n=1 Tax=Flavobacterium pallidum TaxID=2172098 RepID=A0A2S1SDQ6_9FLAO|nr:YjjG family noncanonical pyrimidine nucleotidase [Flavobacterium pallidum]AWI24525.1 noncanonical pyrimidine nucleotidase, YjjG family [Flavobacterium pallidum]